MAGLLENDAPKSGARDSKSKSRECQRKEETHFQGDFILLRIDIMVIQNRRLRYLKREFTLLLNLKTMILNSLMVI